jgi:anthranilate synthase component 2
MKIAIIDNYDSFVFNLVRYVKEAEGVTETKVMRNDEVDYNYLDQCDGILLSPGPGIPSEAGDLLSVIERYETVKPILGVCLGHQAIGEFYKGALEAAPVIYHGKSTDITIENTAQLYAGISSPFTVGRYHSWQVNKQLPEELEATGYDHDGHIMSFQHKSLPIHGVQFHPESVLTPKGRLLINNWIKSCKNH